MESIALRLQGFPISDQVLALARVAEGRSDSGRFAPAAIDELFDGLGLPRPAKVSNVLAALEKKRLVARPRAGRASWHLTPSGRQRSIDLIGEMEIITLTTQTAMTAPAFGQVAHPVLPPWLAPPDILPALRDFLSEYPFDSNVFGMTRFPDMQDDSPPDPVTNALDEASEACAAHGLQFHVASDRKIVDDLWSNVAAHMWASRYGVGFFEDHRDRGVNYNLSIEIGGMLTAGRRVALLKDVSIARLPTDLVGKIYMAVDMEMPNDVGSTIHRWIRDDLRLGACADCAPPDVL